VSGRYGICVSCVLRITFVVTDCSSICCIVLSTSAVMRQFTWQPIMDLSLDVVKYLISEAGVEKNVRGMVS